MTSPLDSVWGMSTSISICFLTHVTWGYVMAAKVGTVSLTVLLVIYKALPGSDPGYQGSCELNAPLPPLLSLAGAQTVRGPRVPTPIHAIHMQACKWQ